MVGLPVDPLSPASLSHQGLIGNPNLTVAQMLWILPHKSRAIFLKNDEKKFSSRRDFFVKFYVCFSKKFFKFLLEKNFFVRFCQSWKILVQVWVFVYVPKLALPNSGNQFLVFVYIFSSLFENILVISSIFFGNSAFSRAYVTYLVQNIFLNYFLFILCQVKVLTWFVCVLLCLSLWLY